MFKICPWVLLALLQGQDQKLPVPSPADQKKAETDIRSIYKDDFAKKTRDAKRALAQKLLKEAADEKNGATSRYVVLLLSRDLAIEGFDLTTIFSSIDQLGKLYDVASPALKVSALNSTQKFAGSPEDSGKLSDAYLRAAEETLREGLYDDALSAAQAAERAAKAGKAASLLERASQLGKEIPELKKEDELFAAAVTTKADDPPAKLVKGRYLLFVVGDEKAGIESLQGCSDEALKNVAKLEAARPTAADALADIGEAWLALSNKEEIVLHKRRYQVRAKYWLNEALKNAGGILRAKLEKRLAELKTAEVLSSPPTKKSQVIDLLKDLDTKKGLVQGIFKLERGVLYAEGTGNPPRALLETDCTLPDEYDVTVVLERTSAAVNNFNLGLMGGGKPFILFFDAYGGNLTGPFVVDDPKNGGVGTKERLLEMGKPRMVTVKVRKNALIIQADEKDFFTWKADWSKVAFFDPQPKNPKVLCLGLSSTTYKVHRLTLVKY